MGFFILGDEVIDDFCQQALQAYINGAVKLLKNMPLSNEILKCSSGLNPAKRKSSKTLDYLQKLPSLVTNVQVDTTEYSKDCRRLVTIITFKGVPSDIMLQGAVKAC